MAQDASIQQTRTLKSESKSGRVPKSSKVSCKSSSKKSKARSKSSTNKPSKSKASSTKSSIRKKPNKSSKTKTLPSKKSRKSQRFPTSAPVRTATSTPTSSPVVLSPAPASSPVLDLSPSAVSRTRAKFLPQLGGTIDIVGYDSRYVFSPNSTSFMTGYNYNEETLYVNMDFVRIYKWEDDLDSWSKWGNDISISEQTIDTFFTIYGMSLAISLDENTLAFGISGEVMDDYYLDRGEVGVYKWNESTESWQQLGYNIGSEVWNERFGETLALSSDGTKMKLELLLAVSIQTIETRFASTNGLTTLTMFLLFGVELLENIKLAMIIIWDDWFSSFLNVTIM